MPGQIIGHDVRECMRRTIEQETRAYEQTNRALYMRWLSQNEDAAKRSEDTPGNQPDEEAERYE